MNPLNAYRHLRTVRSWNEMTALASVAIVLLAQALLAPAYADSADWPLTPAELARLREGAVLVSAELANDRSSGDVRAAVQIRETPERVFRTLTDCTKALQFVPHLQHCAVLGTAPDGAWEEVEHKIHYGWFMPHAQYVFHADYEHFSRIRISNVRGDFREHSGLWEFRPLEGGTATLVTYRVHLVPRFFVPRLVMRSILKRDLPELMKGLRQQAEPPASGATAVPEAPTAR
ncbi:MAG: SRPBCC family protein [Gammaproteobacteria bacterium]